MPSYAKLIRKSGDINAIAKTHRAKVSRALAESAEVAGSLARQLVPVRTGALKASIFVNQTGDLRFEIGAGENYASYVELGTIFRESTPFIRPAMEMARKHLRDILRLK